MKPSLFPSLKLVCLLGLAASATGGIRTAYAQSCDQPCVEGMSCQPATTSIPASHSGSHPCGGIFTEDVDDGYCESGSKNDSCDLGDGTVYAITYECVWTGANCTHSFLGVTPVNVCDC